MLGTLLAVAGIILCSIAASRRTSAGGPSFKGSFGAGLAIAILAGVLSCLPNVGVAFGSNLTRTAIALRVSEASSGNTVWALLFTLGFIVNFAYCAYLIVRRKTAAAYWKVETPRNVGLSAAMAAMWIGSFYLYGAGAAHLGRWGVVVGWPVFISLSILTGNMWGLWRGEWTGSPVAARLILHRGLLVLIIAIIAVALSNRF